MIGAQETEQEPERLWMPEGYHILSMEERQSLSPEELKTLGTHNTNLLREAIHAMTPAERHEIAARLNVFGRDHDLTTVERQYVTIASMMLLATGMKERDREDHSAEQAGFEKLLRDQEETTKGFSSDQNVVIAEADAIEEAIGKEDSRTLYLRTLRPLRARPWNDPIRVCFRKLVRSERSLPRKTSLYDAGLAFLRARQAESPEEGSWYSLEAFLRLSMRAEVGDAKRLFAIANAKNARDVECRIYPILLAEIDGDQAEVERLMPRAREAWPKAEDLDRVLLDDIDMLPYGLQAQARESFGEKYKKAHPVDWGSRAELLSSALGKGRLGEVEGETATLLALPLATLPEPHRSEFLALALRAKAGLGKCDEVAVQILMLEANARAAYPSGYEPDAPPRPRAASEVRELKASLEEERRGLQKLEAALKGGSLESSPEWGEFPKAERRKQAEQWISAMEKEVSEIESILRDRDEPAAAAEWSRRELASWREQRKMTENTFYDLADRGEWLSIRVRSAEGKCYLEKGRSADAARILTPCVGGGQNFHNECVEPMLKVGHALAAQGRAKDAAAIYLLIAPSSNHAALAENLYVEIERAAPGTVRKYVAPPVRPLTPVVTPVP